jgi:hypothetical protein
MTNDKSQITNYKLMIPLLMLFLVMAYGCQKVDKPVRGEEGAGPMAIVIDGDPEDAPESHSKGITSEGTSLKTDMFTSSSLEGLEYWKAYHPALVTGTHNPQLVVATEDEEELCLDCHDSSTSCNNCHGYVGVKLITSDDE